MHTIAIEDVRQGHVLDGRGTVMAVSGTGEGIEIYYEHGVLDVQPHGSRVALLGITAEHANEHYLEDLWGDSRDVVVSTHLMQTFGLDLP